MLRRFIMASLLLPLVGVAEEGPETRPATQPERPMWVAQGKVMFSNGRPAPGVTVRAATGMGTLLGGGSTKTDKDGNYELRFGAGYIGERGRTPPQIAIITASHVQHYETNLNRHGQRAIAEEGARVEGALGEHGTMYPRKPERIDFELSAAVDVEATLVDAAGKPIEGKWLYVDADELPPGSSVLGGGQTDMRGKMKCDHIPPKASCWFSLSVDRRDVKSERVTFERGDSYGVKLIFDGKELRLAEPPRIRQVS